MNRYNFIYILILAVAISLIPSVVSAAILYFEPAEGNFNLGDEFLVDIKLDIGESCVNTVEAEIGFTTGVARLLDFTVGDSLLSIWVERPAKDEMDAINEAGKIYLAGGIPGGYCGKIPGDPGVSNIVGTLVFRIPTFAVSDSGSNRLELKFNPDKTRVFKNDGLGTVDALLTKPAEFTVSPSSALPLDEWQNILRNDKISPEPFLIEILRDDNLYEGRYYVVFSTTDKQSGLDRYEIIELGPGEAMGVAREASWLDRLLKKTVIAPTWQTAVMPYVLKDQTLGSVIKVKAVDKAGNERVVEYVPPQTKAPAEAPGFYFSVIAAAIILLFAISLFIIIKIRRKHGQIENNKL